MLVETTVSAGDVVSIKLVTGEELIGKLIRVDDTAVVINKPFSLIMDNENKLGLMPYCLAASEGQIRFNQNNLMAFPAKVSKNFEDGWIQHTTGIHLASAGSVPKGR